MLRKALATLPPTLDQTYDRILSAISEDDSEYAIRILQWLTFSARPLSVDEIAEVVAIDAKRDPAFNRNEVLQDPLDALNICSSLVTIAVDNNYGQIVALAHYSVKEYLVSDIIRTGKAAKYGMRDDVCHDAIARSCIGYLLQFQQLKLNPDCLSTFRLARYSAEFWIRHARKTGELTKEMGQIAIRLCSKRNTAYVNWIRLWDPENPWEKPDFQKGPRKIPDPLYYAALLNLRGVVKLLLEKGADVHAQGGWYGNALQAASAKGHEQIVKLLLDQGADVHAQVGRGYGNALNAASAGGHEQVVKLLLDQGADVHAQGRGYGNALQAASLKGHEQVVKLLLDQGANVHAQGGIYGNALHAASVGGHEQVVKLLLDQGANANVERAKV
ncbi:ankyrin repeat-containing domain protein [Phaeosphaeriaceae sp. PMI808]|nr:ankyrin repeat-containing domain protein [Phaeosphaeriaceae sp. PMI808]